MRTLQIIVRPQASALSIGGHTPALHGGDHATARDAEGRPTIPASALRGALRLELERLLRGSHPEEPEKPVCSANRDEGGAECPCPVCRLFGQPGTAAGSLRLGDAVLTGAAPASTDLRPRVALSRRRRAAVEELLAFVETTPPLPPTTELRADAWLVGTDDQQLGEDLDNLRAACAAVRAIGGSKARGMGWVECEVAVAEPSPDDPPETSSDNPPELPADGGLRLVFAAQAPLHFGLGPPLGYFQPSRRHAMGATVRGAVAFALLHHGICDGDDPAFQKLVNGTFGSARVAGDRPSVTRRRCRSDDQHVTDDLVAELLRRRAAKAGVALAVDPDRACPVPGCGAVKTVPADYAGGVEKPRVRVRTRTALNRYSGTSMDAKLFSHEVLEPPLTLIAEVWGLDASAAELLAKLHGREVWLGGKVSQGMGLCRLRVEPAEKADPEKIRKRMDDLKGVLTDGWIAIQQASGLAKDLLAADEVPVAVVLTEPWLPTDPTPEKLEKGPLADAGDGLGAFVRLSEEGRFIALEAARHGAPESVDTGEVPPQSVVDAGSVYVYAVPRSTLDERLDKWLEDGRAGVGERASEGWGRFLIRGLSDPGVEEP